MCGVIVQIHALLCRLRMFNSSASPLHIQLLLAVHQCLHPSTPALPFSCSVVGPGACAAFRCLPCLHACTAD